MVPIKATANTVGKKGKPNRSMPLKKSIESRKFKRLRITTKKSKTNLKHAANRTDSKAPASPSCNMIKKYSVRPSRTSPLEMLTHRKLKALLSAFNVFSAIISRAFINKTPAIILIGISFVCGLNNISVSNRASMKIIVDSSIPSANTERNAVEKIVLRCSEYSESA